MRNKLSTPSHPPWRGVTQQTNIHSLPYQARLPSKRVIILYLIEVLKVLWGRVEGFWGLHTVIDRYWLFWFRIMFGLADPSPLSTGQVLRCTNFFGSTSASIFLVFACEIDYVIAFVPARGATAHCSGVSLRCQRGSTSRPLGVGTFLQGRARCCKLLRTLHTRRTQKIPRFAYG